MQTKTKCPYCKSERIVKRGLSPTQNRGRQQRYKCNNCKKTFIKDLGFWKMKTKPSTITMSIDMYLSNLSSRKMRNQIKRHFNGKISHVTILAWIRKYVMKVQRFVDTLKPNLHSKVYADETEIQRGRQNDIFWCAVDWDTRFINATLYSPNAQNFKDAVTFLNKIKDTSDPYLIQTDAMPSYPKAFKKVFWHNKMDKNRVGHRINNVSKTKKHNVRIETVFSKIKDRVYDFRGLKSLASAPLLLAGIVIQHNFIEKHNTTGKVPCELARLKLGLGVDRWMGLIKMSVTV